MQKVEMNFGGNMSSKTNSNMTVSTGSSQTVGSTESGLSPRTKAKRVNRYATIPPLLDWDAKLNEEHVTAMEVCNKYSKDQAKAHFDYISVNYEGIYNRVGYPDPEKVASIANDFVEKSKHLKKDTLKVLDLACGTGLIGMNLKNHGFANIDGVDISPKMLEKAKEKKAYTRLDEVDLSQTDKFPGFMKNKYDVVTVSGFLNCNHMDRGLLEIIIMALKKNGIAVIASRFSFMGKYWFDKPFAEMEQEKRWVKLHTEEFYKYDKLQEGIGRFTKTPVKVFAFRKTQEETTSYKKPNSVFLGVMYGSDLQPVVEKEKDSSSDHESDQE